MDNTLREISVSPSVSNGDGRGHGPAAAGEPTLFPNERRTFRPSQSGPRIGIKQWLEQSLIDLKGLGNRILRAERIRNAVRSRKRVSDEEIDGDPTDDGKTLGKILRGDDHRRFDLDWLDHAEAEYGRDWMCGFLTFLNERYGCEPAKLKPDPKLEEERRKRLAVRISRISEELAELKDDLRKQGGDQ